MYIERIGMGQSPMYLIDSRLEALGEGVGARVADLGGSVAGRALRCMITKEEPSQKWPIVTVARSKNSPSLTYLILSHSFPYDKA